MKQQSDKKIYTVTGALAEAPGVVTLRLSCAGGTPYIPGQFLTVYLPELGTPEGKAYSISSAPHEPLSITVRELGEFSRRLCSLKPGDSLFGSEPEGYFFTESKTSTLVMLAAGIGIAPFRSVALNEVHTNPARPLYLFYSNRTAADMVFKKTFDDLAAAHGAARVSHFITREEPPPRASRGRMSAQAVLHAIGDTPDPEFFICGSIAFVRDLWRGLKSAGISEDRLYTEAFFSH